MISNTSPLIFLAKIGKLNLLKKLFGTISIPEEVKEEVTIKDKVGCKEIKDLIEKGDINVANPKINTDLGVGKGENAAINLAREKKDRIIIDDKTAINILEAMSIEYFRTTSIIFLALEKKIITKKEAISLIKRLIDNGYYISIDVYAQILESLS